MSKVIISLGGNISRVDTAIKVANEYSKSFLLISSEGDPERCFKKINDAGLDFSRVSIDYSAWDTVTNFTNTKKVIESLDPDELIVVTDGFHMLRAMTIARIVYFRSKIKVIAYPHSPKSHDESKMLVLLDMFRSIIFSITGQTLYDQKVYDSRMPYFFNCYFITKKLQGG